MDGAREDWVSGWPWWEVAAVPFTKKEKINKKDWEVLLGNIMILSSKVKPEVSWSALCCHTRTLPTFRISPAGHATRPSLPLQGFPGSITTFPGPAAPHTAAEHGMVSTSRWRAPASPFSPHPHPRHPPQSPAGNPGAKRLSNKWRSKRGYNGRFRMAGRRL